MAFRCCTGLDDQEAVRALDREEVNRLFKYGTGEELYAFLIREFLDSYPTEQTPPTTAK